MTNAPQIQIEKIVVPEENVLTALGVPAKDFGNFMKAFELVCYQAQGMNLTQAAKAANMHRTRIYDPYWKELISSARRMFMGYVMMDAANGAVLAASAVPEIVRSMVNVAQFGARDMEKVQAATWLRDTYPQVFQPAAENNDDQAHFVNSLSTRDYNPMQPIQIIAESGAQVVISRDTVKEAQRLLEQAKAAAEDNGD